MKNSLKIWNITWLHFENPQKQELLDIWEQYDFHEIIIDDIIDLTTQDKIDVYDNHIFLVLHFPKYNERNKSYESNEFSFILWKNFIISITSLPSNNIEKIKKEYEDEISEREEDEKYKISPYYILYVIIDAMYDKSISVLNNSNKDIIELEKWIFTENWITKKALEWIMIKKRNLVFLKYNFVSHSELLEELQKTIEKFYEWQLDLYFEDLAYKIDKIDNVIDIQSKNVNSLTEAYNSLMNIKTNSLLKLLTIFTFIIWTLTFIAGVYGMNVDLPMDSWEGAFLIIMTLMCILFIILLLFFKKKGWLD
jgi:magnesium transporter